MVVAVHGHMHLVNGQGCGAAGCVSWRWQCTCRVCGRRRVVMVFLEPCKGTIYAQVRVRWEVPRGCLQRSSCRVCPIWQRGAHA